jgi:hypothetical protein
MWVETPMAVSHSNAACLDQPWHLLQHHVRRKTSTSTDNSSSRRFLHFLLRPSLVVAFGIMDVANLEAAFERVTVTDENDDQVSTSTTYHKNQVRNDGSPVLM